MQPGQMPDFETLIKQLGGQQAEPAPAVTREVEIMVNTIIKNTLEPYVTSKTLPSEATLLDLNILKRLG